MHKLFENLNATDFSDMYKKRELLRKSDCIHRRNLILFDTIVFIQYFMHDIFIHSMNLLISYSTIYNVRSFKVYINMYWFASFDSPSLSTPLFVLFGLRS